MVFHELLFVLRVGSNPNFANQVKESFMRGVTTIPTSGDSGRGTAFGATAPSDPREEIALWKRSAERDEPPTFSGL